MIKFISLSGPDGVGKTSTIQALHKATNYKYIIYDRDIPDQLCYAKLANRYYDKDWLNYMYSNDIQLYVILNSNIKKIEERMQQRNDSKVPQGTTLEQAINYFSIYRLSTSSNILYIDNSSLTVDEVVKQILTKIQG